ncbi:hypothetical protein BGX27_004050, partial [Mortierella sp. AM989]
MESKKYSDYTVDLPTRKAIIEWFQNRTAAEPEITMPVFCETFNFMNENDAHNAFTFLLSSTNIPSAVRSSMSFQYGSWRRNDCEKYWSSRLTNHAIDVATEKATGNLMGRSEKLSAHLLETLPLNIKGRSGATERINLNRKRKRPIQDFLLKRISATEIELDESSDDSLSPMESHLRDGESGRSVVDGTASSGVPVNANPKAVQIGQKHSRDCSDDNDPAPRKSHQSRSSPLSAPASSSDSTVVVEEDRDTEDEEPYSEKRQTEQSTVSNGQSLSLMESLETLPESNTSFASSTALPLGDVYGQFESGTSTDKNHSQLRRMDVPGNTGDATMSTNWLNMDLLPSDPNDQDFLSEQDLYESTSRMYAWNFLEGSGRHDSNVDTTWTYNNVEVGRDLMDFRDRVVENNGGLVHPYEML